MPLGNSGAWRRRQVLGSAVAGIVTALAGCNTEGGMQTQTERDITDQTPTQTETSSDDQAPTIHEYNAEPQEVGTVLFVSLEGKDNEKIEYAAVQYGNRILEERPDAKKISMNGMLENIQDAEPEEAGQVKFVLKDAAGHMTRKLAYPDQDTPELALKTSATDNEGELELVLEGRDDTGLHTIRELINGTEFLQKDVAGQAEYTDQRQVNADDAEAIQPGEINTVTGKVEDWADNTTEKDVEQYVRKYGVMENTPLDIGAVYIPFTGKYMGKCAENREPSVGHYGDPIPPEITSAHIDQMQGFGITSILYNYNGGASTQYEFEALSDSELLDGFQLQPYYGIGNALKWNEDGDIKVTLANDLKFIKKNFFKRHNRVELSGRPVITFFDVDWLAWGGTQASERVKNAILSEWSEFKPFIQYIRENLTINGREPFIVGDFHDNAIGGYTDQQAELNRQFDAATNWLGLLRNGDTVRWDKQFSHMRQAYKATRKFTRKEGVEFIPNVFPGFDDRGTSDCYGGPGDRHVPRSPEYFSKMLDLADEFRTTDMISIGSWNSWTEGHQIEPGKFKGNDYGTTYLEKVREIQSRSS